MRVYYARALCQYDRSCQGAKLASSRAMVLSPDFATLDGLDRWLGGLTAVERRCRWCRRPIALARFERRCHDPDLGPYGAPVEAADG